MTQNQDERERIYGIFDKAKAKSDELFDVFLDLFTQRTTDVDCYLHEAIIMQHLAAKFLSLALFLIDPESEEYKEMLKAKNSAQES